MFGEMCDCSSGKAFFLEKKKKKKKKNGAIFGSPPLQKLCLGLVYSAKFRRLTKTDNDDDDDDGISRN